MKYGRSGCPMRAFFSSPLIFYFPLLSLVHPLTPVGPSSSSPSVPGPLRGVGGGDGPVDPPPRRPVPPPVPRAPDPPFYSPCPFPPLTHLISSFLTGPMFAGVGGVGSGRGVGGVGKRWPWADVSRSGEWAAFEPVHTSVSTSLLVFMHFGQQLNSNTYHINAYRPNLPSIIGSRPVSPEFLCTGFFSKPNQTQKYIAILNFFWGGGR